MSKKVITAKINSTVQSVCKSMYDNNVGSVVIVKRTNGGIVPVGIITERDVVKIIGSIELFSPQVPIRPFMSSPLVTGSSAMTLSKVIEIMSKKNIRRLPITEKDSVHEKLVGIITEKDIIKAIGKPRRSSSQKK
ncbi:MAG TPA: CBS domain-containing protein [Nitrososphaeraceae archaeon]|nr:CBS domain-containing protein [Nitrososphaeraceae archaeon]